MRAFDAVKNLLTRFEQETGVLPSRIELPKKLFVSLWKDCRSIVGAETKWRPGFFCTEDDRIDAGNPAIEMLVGPRPEVVRILCDATIYQRELESKADKETRRG